MINFYFELSSVADWIVVVLSFIGVCIAGYGLCFAIKTVNKWKEEKEWDIILDACINAKKSLAYIIYVLSDNDFEEEYLSAKEPHNNTPLWSDKSLEEILKSKEDIRFEGYKDTILTIREKLNHIRNKKIDELKEYYNLIVTKSEEREEYTDSFNLFINAFNSGIENDIEKEEMDQFKKALETIYLKLSDRETDFISLVKEKLKNIEDRNMDYFLTKKKPLIS